MGLHQPETEHDNAILSPTLLNVDKCLASSITSMSNSTTNVCLLASSITGMSNSVTDVCLARSTIGRSYFMLWFYFRFSMSG